MNVTVKILGALALIAAALMGSGCAEERESQADAMQAKRVEDQLRQAERAVPPPRITNFTQLRDAVTIMERADQAITTYAYYMDMHGELHFLCEAKGYGLPYSAQTTNPDKVQEGEWIDQGLAVVPQPEPNGMFFPDNVAATWILCVNPETEGFDAVYWEPDLVVSPFRLKAESSLKAG